MVWTIRTVFIICFYYILINKLFFNICVWYSNVFCKSNILLFLILEFFFNKVWYHEESNSSIIYFTFNRKMTVTFVVRNIIIGFLIIIFLWNSIIGRPSSFFEWRSKQISNKLLFTITGKRSFLSSLMFEKIFFKFLLILLRLLYVESIFKWNFYLILVIALFMMTW